ncbi:MAG: pyrroline-5-carboxylate reductase [Erysipelotrichaceae bacterium]|nr:pyrroline-5-carboxylate reductase [Erysipelotrichaceae bacterium]
MKYGFIGTGNMASALIKVMADKVNGEDIFLSNRTLSKAKKLSDEYSCELSDNRKIAEMCDYIILGVKPQMLKGVIDEIKDILESRNDYVLVSMAAGYQIKDYYEMLGFECSMIRIMPNTPVKVNEGIILYCYENTDEGKVDIFIGTLEKAGKLFYVDEDHFDAAGTVSGCGPAYVDMMIEALSDGGVMCGLSRKQAVELASQMMMGSAKLVMESGKNPIELKDEVCSPGGTTIEGVKVLEEKGVGNALMEAIIKAYEKNDKLRKK